jgi:MSHA biogenesis protein MshK
MSLINDALKRAKQVQQEQPARTEPGLQLRPLEARPAERNGLALALPAIALVILGLGCFVVWTSLAHKSKTPGQTAAANPVEQISASVPAALPAPLSIESSTPATTAPISQRVGNSPILTTTSTPSAAQVGTPAPEVPAGTQAAVEAAAPKPVVPRLQGIFYHPTRPSAMINGKSVLVGDKVGEFRVAAIDQESITLAGGGQTNVLTLP